MWNTVARIIAPGLSENPGQGVIVDKLRKVVQAAGARAD
jgi:hypothetical protein